MSWRRAAERVGAPLLVRSRGIGELPSYLVIGTKRGGSTSLGRWISAHPAVAAFRGSKGSHYFDVNYGRGWRWFRSCFPPLGEGEQITGEASPYYLFHPLAPRRIAQALPDVRLIAVLRDPVTRAWSHYHFERRLGSEPLGFEEAVDRESARIAGEEGRFARDPAYDGFAYRHYSYLARGRYAEQLERYLALFPPERILVLQSEALNADPDTELRRVWDFLGLPAVRLPELPREKVGTYDAMPPVVADRLREYFEPHNERLYALPVTSFRWDYAGAR